MRNTVDFRHRLFARRYRRLAALTLSAALWASVARAGVNRWTREGPPDSISSVKVDPGDPGTAYAGGGLGVWKGTGNGSAWDLVGPPEASFSGILAVSASGHLYAAGDAVIGVFQNVLWTSGDGGVTWTVLRSGDFQTTYSVAVDSFDPDVVYLVTNFSQGPVTTSGLERIGGSGRWTSPEGGQPVFYDVVPDPGTEGTLYVTSNVGIFETTDAGSTWTLLNDSMGAVRTLVVDPSAPSILYATISAPSGEGGVSKSVDGGVTFERSNAGMVEADNAGPLIVDSHHPGRLFVATQGGVFRSDDFAATWRGMNEGLIDYFVADIAIDPSGTHLYAATGIGVFDYLDATRDSLSLPETRIRKPVTVRERP
jgi:hypothetical protein